MANVGLYLTQMPQAQGLDWVGLGFFWLGSICIGLLFIGTLIRIAQGRFLLK
jgi:tellurite resistance protein